MKAKTITKYRNAAVARSENRRISITKKNDIYTLELIRKYNIEEHKDEPAVMSKNIKDKFRVSAIVLNKESLIIIHRLIDEILR